MSFANSTYATKVTIDSTQVPSDVSDFALLLSAANLPAAMLTSGSGQECKADGGDLLAYLQDPTLGVEPATRYALDVVSVSLAGGGGTAEVWVRLPSVSGSVDTDVWIVWGDAAASQPAASAAYGRDAVWADDAAVWHLEEDPGGSAPQGIDSTGNGHDLTTTGMSASNQATGQIGGAWEFFGSAEYGQAAYAAALQPPTITVSLWAEYGDAVSFLDGLASVDLSGPAYVTESWTLFAFPDASSIGLLTNADGTPGGRDIRSGGVSAGQNHIVATADGTNAKLYVNGSLVSSDPQGALQDGGSDILVGSQRIDTASRTFDGIIDEVRIRSGAMSADRIATEYASQNAPGTFASNNGVNAIGGAAAFPFYYWYQ